MLFPKVNKIDVHISTV